MSARRHWTLYRGHARLPDAAAPDARPLPRHHRLSPRPRGRRVLLAHGDRHAGYAVRVADGRLVHEYAQDGVRSTVTRSTGSRSAGRWRSRCARRRTGASALVTLVVDGHESGTGTIPLFARRASATPGSTSAATAG